MASSEQRDKIRGLFREAGGGMPLRAFVPLVLDAPIYTSDDLRRLMFRAVQRDCARALSTVDPVTGLPFAKPTDDEPDAEGEDTKLGPTWLQIDLFDYDQLSGLIARELKAVRDDLVPIRRLADYCRERFGQAPDIPAF